MKIVLHFALPFFIAKVYLEIIFSIISLVLQAKRDPYRFRFPIEMRFVDPNIDHLMYVDAQPFQFFCIQQCPLMVFLFRSIVVVWMLCYRFYFRWIHNSVIFLCMRAASTDLIFHQYFIVKRIQIQMSYV